MSRAVLVDSNLLLVWIIGMVEPSHVKDFSRTSAYTEDDFNLLIEYLDRFDIVVILPNVATEVNSLFGKLTGKYLLAAHAILAQGIREWSERYVPSADAVDVPAFAHLGITDSAIIIAAREGMQIITDDSLLHRALLEEGAAVENFTHMRTRNWLQ